MMSLVHTFRTRVLPALLTAAGVVLVTAGLLSYANPTQAGLQPVESEVSGTLDPSIALVSPTPAATAGGGSPSASLVPSGSVAASPSTPASPPASIVPDITPRPGRAVATRIVIPALNIDLPVVAGIDGYPPCNVAMYLHTANAASKDAFGQPGEGRGTYLFAHAQDGMFGPIYELAIEKRNPKKMLGMVVQVYTSDFRLYLYEIREYRLHVSQDYRALIDAMNASKEELWLQTSEGSCRGGRNANGECPGQTLLETQLIAYPISVSDADPREAVPKAKPVRCG